MTAMASSDLPVVQLHPADHEAAQAYYAARGMRSDEHYRMMPGLARWPRDEAPEQPYDRFADLA